MIVPGISKHALLHFVESLRDADCHFALLGEHADYSPDSRVFNGQGEIRAQGYVTGGKKLQGFSCGLDNGIAWASWASPEWMNATIKARGGVIYAKNFGNLVVTTFDFGEEQSSSQALFRPKMPPPGADNAVFWLA